ncbi:cupin domain-containing protein [uncultured Sphingomonas sp.]|uniref:cupin domain-containing protein n=1 Tax=uncultured Sphingomonas sp. TaxID=158754 RepID=UPI0035C9CC1F
MPHPLVARLDLSPHPEGGWFRETMRVPSVEGARGLATAILFLLDAGERSHWHRVDAAELWIWNAGDPLTLLIAATGTDSNGVVEHVLGPANPQVIVPSLAWQAAEPRSGWALVSCVVVPAFDFAGFELAPPGWYPPGKE